MARDSLPITALGIDAATAADIDTITAANGVTIPAGGNTGKLLIRITHTDTLENDATIVAPTDNAHALRAGIGDLVTAFAAGDGTAVTKYFVIESARFAQTDGAIHIDFESTFTGSIECVRLPEEA